MKYQVPSTTTKKEGAEKYKGKKNDENTVRWKPIVSILV